MTTNYLPEMMSPPWQNVPSVTILSFYSISKKKVVEKHIHHFWVCQQNFKQLSSLIFKISKLLCLIFSWRGQICVWIKHHIPSLTCSWKTNNRISLDKIVHDLIVIIRFPLKTELLWIYKVLPSMTLKFGLMLNIW